MIRKSCPSLFQQQARKRLVAILCSALLPGQGLLFAQTQTGPTLPAPALPPPPATQGEKAEPKLPAEQLDSLVAPIALYPDPLLSQVLVASTYPLEIVQLQQWLTKNKGLKDKALSDAVAKQPWDPSIQGLAALPEVVKRLGDDIKWTTDLGNAFLAQQTEVFDAVQRMRKKAQDTGALKTNDQQKVETKVVEEKQVIVVQQSNPEVIYVPSYNPTVVYGAPYYPYPPIYYPPPPPPGSMFVAFSFGVMMGAAFHGGWGYGCGWGGGGNVYINHNNTYVNRGNQGNINRGNSNWNHNPQHRGGAPYASNNMANKYGGSARGDSLSNRQGGAGQQPSRGGGAGPSAGTSDRSRGGGASASTADRSGRGGGGADQIGSRDVSRGSGSGGSSAFSGSRDSSGASARASSSRGSSSFSSSRGGGGASRGGGGRGGGRR